MTDEQLVHHAQHYDHEGNKAQNQYLHHSMQGIQPASVLTLQSRFLRRDSAMSELSK